MAYDVFFFFNASLLGLGLAADAFSISVANGLADPYIRKRRMLIIAGVFGIFQAVMPILGRIIVLIAVEKFNAIEKFIPYISFMLLLYIGIKMITEKNEYKADNTDNWIILLLIQAVATSIDALSVGFTIVEHTNIGALIYSGIIGAVTFALCLAGISIGKKAGGKFSGKAEILGGIVLILIGFEIFIRSKF